MGKFVINNDPFAYKPEYNQQVSGAKVVAPPNSKAGENDPFAYRPEYNADVKKKVGGTESEIGITEPSPTQSELQSKKENATNFLITDINQNDFFSKLASQTDQYFSHTTPQRVNEQAAAVTQNEVFRNPASLQRYTDQRIKDINEELANIEREKNKLQENLVIGADVAAKVTRSITDQKRYNELSQQAIEKENYKKQLKNNVAELAADQILSQMDLSGDMDLGKIGRQISSIADPEQEKIFQMAEKGGKTLPGIKREQMNYAGIQAVKSYLARNPKIPNYDQIVKNVNDLESNMDELNPQTTDLRVREKIGASIYKKGNEVTLPSGQKVSAGGFFGIGYSPDILKIIAEDPETALTPTEKKRFYETTLPTERRLIGTNIPISGMTRAFYNAVEKSSIGAGKSIADKLGLRDESDQAQDLLTQEVTGSRYRPPGESPTAQAKLAYLNNKGKTGKLTNQEQAEKKELENYTYVRNGWSKWLDGMGDLTGQVAQIIFLTRGIGAGGKLLTLAGAEGGLLGGATRSALGTILSNETTGLVLSGYVNSLDNYKQQAIELMPGEDQAAARKWYANSMAAFEGVSELIMRDTKALGAFMHNVSKPMRELSQRVINREITQRIAREELQSIFAKYAKPFVKAEVFEGVEEGVVDIWQGINESLFTGSDFDVAKTGKQALNTFLTTMLYSPLVSGMAAHGAYRQNKSQNAVIKSAIVDMAANPSPHLLIVEDLLLDGTITQQEANEKIKLIKSANQYLQEIPLSRRVNTTVGQGEATRQEVSDKAFDYPEISSYLLHRMNEGILTEKIENTTDEILKSKLQKDLKRSQEIRKGLFEGRIGITTDLNEVTDNSEISDELGIFNTNQVQPDELIGTPFEQQSLQVIEQNRILDLEEIDQKISNSKSVSEIEALKKERKTINDYYDQQVETYQTKKTTIETSATEIQNVETRQISAEQEKDATDFANELLDENIIPAGYQDMARNKPMEFWEFVAQQAQNVDANWQPLKSEDAPLSEQAAIDDFGETIVNYAKELFPAGSISVAPITKSKNTLGEPTIVQVDDGELYEFQTNEGKVAGVMLSPTEFRIDGISAAEVGKGQGSKLFEGLINYLQDKGVTTLTTQSAGEGAKKMHQKAVDKGLLTRISEEGPNATFTIPPKIKQDEKQINKKADDKKGNEEINAPEGANETSGTEEVNVLTEEGAEPIAEAPLELTEEEIQKPLEVSRAKKVSEALRGFASKIQKADITGAGGAAAQSDITRVPRETIAFAINRVADAIDAGEAVVNAIQKGVDYIREQGHVMGDDSFKSYTTDLIAGKKPRVRVSTEPQEKKAEEDKTEETEPQQENNEPPTPPRPPSDESQSDGSGNIDDYEMTTSGEVNRFLSGNTWDDVFGEKAEGNQNYLTQKLSDMLQDGKNMIAIAQQKWGGDVMMYAKPLFQLIQAMSNDKAMSNKKAVLLATFLGELQEAKKRSPERFDAISQIEKAVFAYYQNYMNVRGKEIVAGRLLRLYRDKYIGDIYADMILEKEQIKAKKAIQEIEQSKQIDDKTASEETKPITEEEKKKEDKAAKKKSDTAKKEQSKKKKMTSDEAKRRADDKVKEIEEKMGKDGRGGLINRIKEAINKLNCK